MTVRLITLLLIGGCYIERSTSLGAAELSLSASDSGEAADDTGRASAGASITDVSGLETDTHSASDASTVELCLSISIEGPDCAEWVTARRAEEDAACGLASASDGELWAYRAGWVAAPIAERSGEFGMLCGEMEAVPGDVLHVNGRFVNRSGEVPMDYGGEWWWCANWYGVGARIGVATIDGTAANTELLPGESGGGLSVKRVHFERRAHL